ncbi:hypothetical protein OH768_34085 [Streptomyces sp. NBC_01622]|uniref:hypothetical protein n=1 Tax=Streptomyces sp. NBC_01622 TaxID=2975903 RepID=UPI003865630B|nr:hypothetical protein OH768_34085 [Streptomyces sp. NBC_01622]
MRTDQEPISLLGTVKETSPMPIRPEYIEEMALVPALPDHRHSKGAFELAVQLHSAGLLSGMGNGYRVTASPPNATSRTSRPTRAGTRSTWSPWSAK